MKRLVPIAVIVLIFLATVASAQEVCLQHRLNPKRQRHLDVGHQYYIKATGDIQGLVLIAGCTDSSLVVVDRRSVELIGDSVLIETWHQGFFGTWDSEKVRVVKRVWVNDTLPIALDSLLFIEKHRFRDMKFLEPIVMLVFFPIVITPVMVVFEAVGGDFKPTRGDWMVLGAMWAVELPLWVLGRNNVKYDMQNRWRVLPPPPPPSPPQ